MSTIATILLFLGYVLMPFSTAPANLDGGLKSGALPSGVIHLGLPLLLAAACAPLFSGQIWRYPFNRHGFFAALAFVLCVLYFTLLSPDRFASAARAAVNVVGFGLFVYFTGQAGTKLTYRVANLLVLSGATMSIYYLGTLLVRGLIYGQSAVFAERWVGGLMSLPWGATNTIASILLFPLVVTFALFPRSNHKKLHLAAAILIAMAIIMTFSRNGIMCMMGFLFAYSLLVSGKSTLLPALIFSSIAAVFTLLISEDAKDFLLNTRIGDMHTTIQASNRPEVWKIYLDHLSENLFSPIGYYSCIRVFELSPHNWWLLMLTEMGIFGLLAGLAMYLYAGAKCIQTIRAPESRCFLLGLIFMFLNVQFEDPQYNQPYIIYFWTFFAIIARQADLLPVPARAEKSEALMVAPLPASA